MMALLLLTAEVLNVPVYAEQAEVKLTDMHYMEEQESKIIEDGITDSYGNIYSENVLRLAACNEGYISFDLDGYYDFFEGKLVASTDTNSNAKMDVGIFADGELVYETKEMTRQQAPQEIRLNVHGVGLLEIKTGQQEYCGDSFVYIVEGKFQKATNRVDAPKWDKLSNLVLIDSQRFNAGIGLMKDSYGNLHDGFLQFNAEDSGYAMYNLNKQYETFRGAITTSQRTNNEISMNMEIFLDDTLVYSETGITKQTPQIDIALDTKDASTIKIVTSYSGDYHGDGLVYVVDSFLVPDQK